MSPFASRIGLPTFNDSSRARSSKWSRICWPRSHNSRPRLLGSRSRHSGNSKARRAASTAESTSSFVPEATRAIGRFVAGSKTSAVAADEDGTDFAAMYKPCSCTSIVVPVHERAGTYKRVALEDVPVASYLARPKRTEECRAGRRACEPHASVAGGGERHRRLATDAPRPVPPRGLPRKARLGSRHGGGSSCVRRRGGRRSRGRRGP